MVKNQVRTSSSTFLLSISSSPKKILSSKAPQIPQNHEISDILCRPVVDTHLDNGEMPLQGGDIVGLLLFLASDMSRGITGAIIPVDKGFSVI